MLFVALGVAAIGRRRWDVALLVLLVAAPFAVALPAAVAQPYPFCSRPMLCLLPPLVIALAAGAECARCVAGRAHPALGAAATVALLVPPPYDTEHQRAALAHLARARPPGEAVYVHRDYCPALGAVHRTEPGTVPATGKRRRLPLGCFG